jgi:hypothetical protein
MAPSAGGSIIRRFAVKTGLGFPPQKNERFLDKQATLFHVCSSGRRPEEKRRCSCRLRDQLRCTVFYTVGERKRGWHGGTGPRGPHKLRLNRYGGMMRRGGVRMREGVDNFFSWTARNPLKSPESDEGIQINPRESKPILLGFSWSGLDSAWRKLA